jgi:hypothetical protein
MTNRQLGKQNVLHVRIFILALLLAAISVGTGCTSKRGTEKNPDPFEPINRGIYKFNDVADTYVLRPVAKGYQAITPDPLERGISNAFDTWTYPVTIVNDFLQGKFKQGFSDTGRFVVNRGNRGLVGQRCGLRFGLLDRRRGVVVEELEFEGQRSRPRLGVPLGLDTIEVLVSQ